MLFNSYNFIIFFPAVIIVYFLVPKRWRYIWLLITSYYFYMCWNAKYALLIAFSTVTTYLCGVIIGFCNRNTDYIRWKKIIVAINVVINLFLLGFFKYFDFILNNINVLLNQINITTIDNPFDIVLPVGISFYTFQSLGYSIDVYRGDLPAEKNFFKYALFVSFFPQLVAGPIERAKNLLLQIHNIEKIKLFDYRRVSNGFILMIWGFFLKMVLADRVAILVNTVFDRYYMYSSLELVSAAIGFAIQIYCDFSSYSTIACGAAQIMGFELMENFESPYFSLSIKEFWRRWHISLSTWFKDYLYIPLGGNHCSKVRKYVNILITFLVSGLWHGANWTFIVWGGIHGGYQIIGDILFHIKEKIINKFGVRKEKFSYKLGKCIINFILVDFAWIFFRANSMSEAAEYIKRIFVKINPWALFDGTIYTLGLNRREFGICIFAIMLLFIVDCIKYKFKLRIDLFLENECLWFRWSVIIFLIFCIFVFGKYGSEFDAQSFIYFQF